MDLKEDVKVIDKEMELALKLIDDMTEKWEPEKYKVEYRLKLMERIKAKAEGMGLKEKAEEEIEDTNEVDIMDLLKKSVSQKEDGKKESSSKKGE